MRRIAVLLVTLAALTACTESNAGRVPPPASANGQASTPQEAPAPGMRIETVAGGLEHGWDIAFLPDGKALVSQRPGKLALLSSTRPGATVTQVQADFTDVLAVGEGGLMGMVLDPDFATNREFITCQTYKENGVGVDVRLVRWRLAADGSSAQRVNVMLSGLPVARNGRHSGCRPAIAPDGALIVGTGDTARAPISQDRTNLGGKVLRLDVKTGGPAQGNPFSSAQNPNEQRLFTYGHRNVQGVAIRPGSGQIITAEHGPDKNDEINVELAGRNYGWDPAKGGTETSYDEDVPMTDLQRFPDAVPALWESGDRTEAVCAATFLDGPQWGTMNGSLVVTALKGAKLLLFKMDDAGKIQSVSVPPEFDDDWGRLRAARQGPDGALYVTTSNGNDDKLLRVTLG
ncbi:PQQ-dependent sugar dehydrogenase [Kibdelosporangium persicum]|nr:PQQ-dependent sugar dehydrogenase [Kibdelosporangium persicum]